MTRKIACILFVVCICFFPWQAHAGWFESSAEAMINALLTPIGYLLLQVSSFVLWFSGVLLNMSLSISVLNFKGIIEKIGVISAGWQAVRDILNIFFVVALLKAGFSNILGKKTDVAEIIKNLIIGAIGINFSILIATTAIDISNAFGLHYYKYIVTPPTKSLSTPANTVSALDGGISAQIMDYLGVATFFNLGKEGVGGALIAETAQNAVPILSASSGKSFAYFILASIMVLMVAFSFALAAIMFLYRAVALIVLLITAPFAFAGHILPELAGQAKTWRDTLEKECLWPPIYFMALYVGMQVLQSEQFKAFTAGGGAGKISFVGLLSGDPNAIAGVFNFVVVLVILNGALLVANNFGPKGLKAGKDFAHKLVTGAAGSALSAGARGTKYWTSNSLRGVSSASNSLGFSRTGRVFGALSNAANKRSWDIRNVPGVPENAGVFGVTGEQVGFGKPGEYFGKKPETEIPQIADLIGPEGNRLGGLKNVWEKNKKQTMEFFAGDEKAQIDEAIKDTDNITENDLPNSPENRARLNARNTANAAFRTAQATYAANPTGPNKEALDRAQDSLNEAQKAIDKEVQSLKVQHINEHVVDAVINKKAKDRVANKDEAEAIKNAALRFRAEDALRASGGLTAAQKIENLFDGPIITVGARAGQRDTSKGIKGAEIKNLIENGSTVFNVPTLPTLPSAEVSLFLNRLTNRHLEAIKGAEIDDTLKLNIANYFGTATRTVPAGGGAPVTTWTPRAGLPPNTSAQRYFQNSSNWGAWGL